MNTASGQTITPDTALQTSAVFACVRVIAETIASLPLKIYEKNGDGSKSEVPGHPLNRLLSSLGPTPWLTAPEFWEMQAGHNALRGNAYTYKVFDGAGRIIGLVPLDPSKMQMSVQIKELTSPEIRYVYHPAGIGPVTSPTSAPISIPPENIWHLKGISTNGYEGLSPITLARESIGLTLAAERHGATYFKNGTQPSGIATVQNKLSDDAFKRFSDQINNAMSGDNKFKAIVLEMGATWQQIGMNNADAQFLETRRFQVEDIARVFRVPGILIGHPDKTSTYASAEQFMISFVTHTIRPWLVRLEKSISKYLLPENEQQKRYAEFNVDGLLRGDYKTRMEGYALAIQNKIMNPNEARAKENMNPYEGGDEYENPNIQVKEQQNGNDGETDIQE